MCRSSLWQFSVEIPVHVFILITLDCSVPDDAQFCVVISSKFNPSHLNKLRYHVHFLFLANRITWPRLLIQIQIYNGKQCRSKSVGFWRSQLILLYTVCKGRAYPGTAGLGLTLIQTLFKAVYGECGLSWYRNIKFYVWYTRSHNVRRCNLGHVRAVWPVSSLSWWMNIA